MANEKTIKTRIQLKNDTETNWEKAVNFIPRAGELIIYSADDAHPFSRLKVGDGETTVTVLPFIDSGTVGGKVLETIIIQAASRAAFPPSGDNDKLYVDLAQNAIYCYNNNSGYTKLSHFRYTATTTTIPIIQSWDAGVMTTVTQNGNRLEVVNGVEPTLVTGSLEVVTGIREVTN